MGRTDEWEPHLRSPVSDWLRTAEHGDLVADLTTLTGIDHATRDDLSAWLRDGLAVDIDAAVANPAYRHAELSELLANAGVLPMFGFPTRSRRLWGGRPLSNDVDKAIVAERQLEIALAHYAPGQELLTENRVHTVVGFADFEVKGKAAYSVDPLSDPLFVSRCTECQTTTLVDDDGPGECPVCAATTVPFRLVEPYGFRTTFNPSDYTDSVERPGFIGQPTLGFLRDIPWQRHEHLLYRTRAGADVFVFNDNRGELFAMHRQRDKTVVVPTENLYTDRPAWVAAMDTAAADMVAAIGYVKRTDVLALLPTDIDVPGPVAAIDVRAVEAGIPAFWSFAEAIRRSATLAILGVDPSEVHVGLQSYRLPEDDVQTRLVYLADALENGAGYASYLGSDPSILGNLLERVLVMDWATDPLHRQQCAQSCPRCLRSYDNRFMHPWLDWRLALDLTDLVLGRSLVQARWLEGSDRLVENTIKAFAGSALEGVAISGGLPAILAPRVGRAAFFSHPLHRTEEAYFTPEQQAAADDLRSRGAREVRSFDVRELRRPSMTVYAWLTQ
jgi:DEAD/DEAH box helicase domain-containing protein